MKQKTLTKIQKEINDYYKIVKLLADYFKTDSSNIIISVVNDMRFNNTVDDTYSKNDTIEKLHIQLDILKNISLYYKDNFSKTVYNEVNMIILTNLDINNDDDGYFVKYVSEKLT